MTDGNGVVEKFQSYSIPGTNFEVVIAPKHFELYRRKFDTSGISENVFVLRLSPDGPERISRTEVAALCYDCLNGVGEHSEDQRTVRWVGDVTSRAGKTASGKDYTIFSRTLMVDGVPKKISMEAEDARSFEWMGEGLARELSKVPERAWVYTDEVEVYLYMADKYGLDEEGVAGSYDRYAHRIRIFGAGVREATGVDETIRHEFGHSLIAFAGDGKMSGEQIIAMILLAIAATGPEVEERYKGSTGSVHFQSSWEERFSEALKLYLGENPIFRVADTLMSSVIDMFLDPET
jgi:hypothetical protein